MSKRAERVENRSGSSRNDFISFLVKIYFEISVISKTEKIVKKLTNIV